MFLQIFSHKVKCLHDERPVFSSVAQRRNLSCLQIRSSAPFSAKTILLLPNEISLSEFNQGKELWTLDFYLKLFSPICLCICLFIYKFWEQSEWFRQSMQCKSSECMVLMHRKYFHMDLLNMYPWVNAIGIQIPKASMVNQ